MASLIAPARLRHRQGSALSRKQAAAFAAAVLLLPLVFGLIVGEKPLYAIVLLAAAGVFYLAGRSLAFPVALSGVPSLLIGLYGSNPLPGKVVFASLTLWLMVGLGLVLLAGHWPKR